MNMHKIRVALVGVAIVTSASACGGTGAVEQLGHLQQVSKNCQDGVTLSGYVAFDGRGSLRGHRLTVQRLNALKPMAESVAACGGGHLKVVAFGPSPAATAVVFDADLHPAGATTNARLLRIPRMAEDVIRQVSDRLPNAFRRLTRQGADPIAQLQLASDYAHQLGADSTVHVLIETSGMTRVATPNLTDNLALKYAQNGNVPDLHGVLVTVAGLGHVGSTAPPSTRLLDALRTYYKAVCRRTGASCRAVTDIVTGS